MKAILAVLFLIGLAVPSFAGEVPTGTSYWSSGGEVVRVDVMENPSPAAGDSWVQGVDASGFSNVADGTGTYGCSNSGEFDTGTGKYKIMSGRVYKKNGRGKWVAMKKVKQPSRRGGNSMSIIAIIGDEVVSLPQ